MYCTCFDKEGYTHIHHALTTLCVLCKTMYSLETLNMLLAGFQWQNLCLLILISTFFRILWVCGFRWLVSMIFKTENKVIIKQFNPNVRSNVKQNDVRFNENTKWCGVNIVKFTYQIFTVKITQKISSSTYGNKKQTNFVVSLRFSHRTSQSVLFTSLARHLTCNIN